MVSRRDFGKIALAAWPLSRALGAKINSDINGVRIGVQNHSGMYVCNASGLRALLAGYDPKHVGAVWDAAHNALQVADLNLFHKAPDNIHFPVTRNPYLVRLM